MRRGTLRLPTHNAGSDILPGVAAHPKKGVVRVSDSAIRPEEDHAHRLNGESTLQPLLRLGDLLTCENGAGNVAKIADKPVGIPRQRNTIDLPFVVLDRPAVEPLFDALGGVI